MVIEVEYGEVTPNGHLRAPAYLHERADLDPAGVVTDVII